MKGFYSEIWLNVQEKQCKKFKSYRKNRKISQIKECQKKFGFIWPQYISINSSIRFKFASVAGDVAVYVSHVEQRQVDCFVFRAVSAMSQSHDDRERVKLSSYLADIHGYLYMYTLGCSDMLIRLNSNHYTLSLSLSLSLSIAWTNG